MLWSGCVEERMILSLAPSTDATRTLGGHVQIDGNAQTADMRRLGDGAAVKTLAGQHPKARPPLPTATDITT